LNRDESFESFVDNHTDSLLVTAYLMTHDRSSAEELVQDTMVALYSRWNRVMQADSLLAYVRRSLLNRYLNQKRAKSSTEYVTAEVPDGVVFVDFSTRVDDQDALSRALRRLPPRQRAALVLRFFHDLPDKDAAETLGCRVGTLRSLVSRALATLRLDPSLSIDIDNGSRKVVES